MNIEDLARVRLVVTHAGCPDGIASAIILKDVLGSRDDFGIVWAQHGTAALRDLPAVPGMLFCDIPPPRERVAEFIEAGALVLDHHVTQRDIVEAFGERGVFADERTDPGVCGAMLAYEKVWTPLRGRADSATWDMVSDFALLSGIRDTWQRNHRRWAEACAQAEALRFWPVQELLDAGLAGLPDKLAIGPVLLDKARERDDRSIAEAYRFELGGIRALAFEGHWTSDISDRLEGEVDVVMGWHYGVDGDTQKLVVSVRSRGGFDAAAFAKFYGGGGHKQAAGFTLAMTPGAIVAQWNPYDALTHVLRVFVERGGQ